MTRSFPGARALRLLQSPVTSPGCWLDGRAYSRFAVSAGCGGSVALPDVPGPCGLAIGQMTRSFPGATPAVLDPPVTVSCAGWTAGLTRGSLYLPGVVARSRCRTCPARVGWLS